jgi:uncharacterized membrane protein YsdA (DUF1294 family)
LDPIWIYLLIVNGGGLLLMGFDKLSAKMNSNRIPEMWFVLISLAGGFGGVVLGMLVFRHKIRKLSFQLKILVAAVLGILIIVFLIKGR